MCGANCDPVWWRKGGGGVDEGQKRGGGQRCPFILIQIEVVFLCCASN